MAVFPVWRDRRFAALQRGKSVPLEGDQPHASLFKRGIDGFVREVQPGIIHVYGVIEYDRFGLRTTHRHVVEITQPAIRYERLPATYPREMDSIAACRQMNVNRLRMTEIKNAHVSDIDVPEFVAGKLIEF